MLVLLVTMTDAILSSVHKWLFVFPQPSAKRMVTYEMTCSRACGPWFIISQRGHQVALTSHCEHPTATPFMLVYFYHLGSLKDYPTSFFSAKQITDSKEFFPFHLSESRVSFSRSCRPRNMQWGFFPQNWPHTACAPVASPVTRHF